MTYSGSPGSVNASLIADGKSIDSISGLSDAKAAKKWAKETAKQYKDAQTLPEKEEDNVFVSLAGSKAFSL
jgi:hypothetical protein